MMTILKRRLFAVWLVGLVLLCGVRPGPAAQVSKWEWDGVDRIVAIGDVHASYDKFLALLRGTGLAWAIRTS